MFKIMKFKSIILENGLELEVEQILDKDSGIKFYVTKTVYENFNILLGLRQTISLKKIKVRLLNNKIYTLFNCFYNVRGIDELYIHLVYNELVKSDVEDNNFKCNKLVVNFDNNANLKRTDFSENIHFIVDDIKVVHYINKKSYTVIISSKKIKNRDELFLYFSYYFEIINLIIGYFPTITKMNYKLDLNSYIVETKLVNKYITSDEYKKNDLWFLKKLDNETFKNAYIKYKRFSDDSLLQMSMFFMCMMKNKSYIEIEVVNILQTLDGLYDRLTRFNKNIEDYPQKMNNDIIDKICKIDFSDINKKYKNDVNINDRIKNYISRMNYTQYRKKLKNVFKYDKYLVFKEERKKNNDPFINYDIFLTKCVNSRNKFSHVSNQDIYLFEEENIVYIHKLILIIRLLIQEEIGLKKFTNLSALNAHITLLNDYIKKVLSKK